MGDQPWPDDAATALSHNVLSSSLSATLADTLSSQQRGGRDGGEGTISVLGVATGWVALRKHQRTRGAEETRLCPGTRTLETHAARRTMGHIDLSRDKIKYFAT